jgi:hypothetical protein
MRHWGMQRNKQPWLSNPLGESVFILAPSLFPVALIFVFQDYFTSNEVSLFWWVLLVMCIDVGHVYSTLFRLYWDRDTFHRYRNTLVAIPVIAFIAGFGLHYYDSFLFWRVLAYVAVFHFVRQQYGFLRLYSRMEKTSAIQKGIDAVAIYSATVYPLLYWHANATDKLAWFVRGDFIQIDPDMFFPYATWLYVSVILVYLAKEVTLSIRQRMFNVPRNVIVLGTFVSWYVGIVLFQGDLIFTLLNVVAHGVPYMALIWIYGEKRSTVSFSFNRYGILIFCGVLLLLAYMEEFFWDVLVWKDHPEIFPSLFSKPDNPAILSFVVAILVLPQVTHYVLDGFIWRFSKDTRARI